MKPRRRRSSDVAEETASPVILNENAGEVSAVRKSQRRRKLPLPAEAATKKTADTPRIEAKLDHLMAAVDDFKAVTARNNCCPSNCNFQSLYMDAEKKIDALMEAYHELEKELQFFKGKVDAYESLSRELLANQSLRRI